MVEPTPITIEIVPGWTTILFLTSAPNETPPEVEGITSGAVESAVGFSLTVAFTPPIVAVANVDEAPEIVVAVPEVGFDLY